MALRCTEVSLLPVAMVGWCAKRTTSSHQATGGEASKKKQTQRSVSINYITFYRSHRGLNAHHGEGQGRKVHVAADGDKGPRLLASKWHDTY